MKRFLFIIIILALAVVAIGISHEEQQKQSQAEILEAVPFDKVVLTTLVALERNYQVRKRLFPLIHEDDYYAVILNTAKRITLESATEKPESIKIEVNGKEIKPQKTPDYKKR